jgi:hypothetical protein
MKDAALGVLHTGQVKHSVFWHFPPVWGFKGIWKACRVVHPCTHLEADDVSIVALKEGAHGSMLQHEILNSGRLQGMSQL